MDRLQSYTLLLHSMFLRASWNLVRGRSFPHRSHHLQRKLPMELILIIVILVLLFGGGGYWGRRRRHW
jgi:hypothetical protein